MTIMSETDLKIYILAKLNQAMYERGYTQADLSYASGLSKATISRYCSGEIIPSTYNLYILSDVLNKPISFFFD